MYLKLECLTTIVNSGHSSNTRMYMFFSLYPESPMSDLVKSEPDTKDMNMNSPVQCSPSGSDTPQHSAESYMVPEQPVSNQSQRLPKMKLISSCPWHLRLDYLVAIGPPGMPGCYCMVCSEQLPLARVGTFRRHIQDCHPDTTNLSQREREEIASAWTQMANKEEPVMDSEEGKPFSLDLSKCQVHCRDVTIRHKSIQFSDSLESEFKSVLLYDESIFPLNSRGGGG